MLALIRAAPVVRVDETSIKTLGATKSAFMWAFLYRARIAPTAMLGKL